MPKDLRDLEQEVIAIKNALPRQFKPEDYSYFPKQLDRETFDKWYNLNMPQYSENEVVSEPVMQYDMRGLLGLGKKKLPKITLKEILHLLEDGYNGNFNKLLQEAIKNAEIELKISPVDLEVPQGHQQLEINIKVASTLIDRYAGVLTQALGKSKSKEQDDTPDKSAKIIEQSKNQLDSYARQLRDLETRYREQINLLEIKATLAGLPRVCYDYRLDHKESSNVPGIVLSLFPCFFKTDHKQYQAILSWLSTGLPEEPLTFNELVGGIFHAQDMLSKVKNKHDRETLLVGIENLLSIHKDKFKDLKKNECVQAFFQRAESIGMELPQLLEIPSTKGQLVFLKGSEVSFN